MKKLNMLLGALAVVAGFTSCQNTASVRQQSGHTPETEALLKNMKTVHERGFMFGHHDDPVYGIGWDGDRERSDVKSVCGDYPAVMSFDLGRIELGGDANLDKVPFARLREEIVAQYNRGGMVSLSWHVDNPKTGKDSWDVSDSTVVASILPGGVNHDKFLGWLDKVADFMNSLKTDDGTKVPVFFRPWHEHTGSWFWWGQALCSDDEYKGLWHMTYERLKEKGVDNVLYAYSPGSEPRDTTQYLQRYPGDDIVDLVGFDTYQFDRDAYLEQMERSLDIVTEVGKAHDKVIAVTETGYETIPDSLWWTETLMPVLSRYPIAYVLVWRNARERENHYYAPYPGQVSANDFVRFYNDPKTLFAGDIKNVLYRK